MATIKQKNRTTRSKKIRETNLHLFRSSKLLKTLSHYLSERVVPDKVNYRKQLNLLRKERLNFYKELMQNIVNKNYEKQRYISRTDVLEILINLIEHIDDLAYVLLKKNSQATFRDTAIFEDTKKLLLVLATSLEDYAYENPRISINKIDLIKKQKNPLIEKINKERRREAEKKKYIANKKIKNVLRAYRLNLVKEGLAPIEIKNLVHLKLQELRAMNQADLDAKVFLLGDHKEDIKKTPSISLNNKDEWSI